MVRSISTPFFRDTQLEDEMSPLENANQPDSIENAEALTDPTNHIYRNTPAKYTGSMFSVIGIGTAVYNRAKAGFGASRSF